MDSIFEKSGFATAFKKHEFLIAAHRGAASGNVIENTIEAYRAAFLSGADICEIDLICSSDGVLYCFHDGSETVNLHHDIDIRGLSSTEIDKMTTYNRLGLPSGKHLDRFEVVIDTFCNGELFNVDRCWSIFPQVFEILKYRPETTKQLMFKAPMRKAYLEQIQTYGNEFLFMPIVYSVSEIEQALAYNSANIAGFELIADSLNHELFGFDICKKIHDNGKFVWVNALDLSEAPEHILYGGLNDTKSIRQCADKGWGVIANFGVDVIQTDFPALLNNWRNKQAEMKEDSL